MRSIGRTAATVLLWLAASAGGTGAEEAAPVHKPDQVDFAMLFMADVRDSPQCDVTVSGGRIGFGEAVTNPAMTCPDAFAWKLMADSVKAGFWENWSTNRQVWPSDPWPRCAPGETGEAGNCCPAVATSNEAWPEHCPVFPGVAEGTPEHGLAEPGVAAQVSLAEAAPTDANGDGRVDWADVPAALRTPVIGSIQGELVYRNRAMVDYIFDRGLYAAEGPAGVFANFSRTTETYAPYWPEPHDPTVAHPAPPATAAIVFPISSVMIKADWIAVDDARKVGIDPDDPDHPFIRMNLVPIDQSNQKPDGTPATKPHILVSFHISSKDMPNWFWSTFEHVANQGRCDWIGCNDSFGHVVTSLPVLDGKAGLAPPARNFTPPHEVAAIEGFKQSAYVLGERYLGVDEISDGLAAIFSAYGIGTAEGVNGSGRPTAADVAWRSYRLKGSQTGFVTPTGRTVRLGNSVTEAGFVNTASCMTCHARAGATEAGTPPLAIFADTIGEIGMPQSVNGVPVEAWFNVNAYRNAMGTREAPGIIAVQTDFVWGFRNACPMKPVPFGPSWCRNVVPPAQ